jgi:hypothetical protein
MARSEGAQEESLELIEERVRRADGRQEDDEEVLLQQLVDVFHPQQEPVTAEGLPKPLKRDEFVCTSCNLAIPRKHLADEERLICRDCLPDHESRRPPSTTIVSPAM